MPVEAQSIHSVDRIDMSEELRQLETPHRASGHRTVVERANLTSIHPLMMIVEVLKLVV